MNVLILACSFKDEVSIMTWAAQPQADVVKRSERSHLYLHTKESGRKCNRETVHTNQKQGYQFLFQKSYPQFCTTSIKAPTPTDSISSSNNVTSGKSSHEIPKPTGINPKVCAYCLCHLFSTQQKSCFLFLKLIAPDVTLNMHLFIMSKAYLEILIFQAYLIGVS